jgi:hypothetical protein
VDQLHKTQGLTIANLQKATETRVHGDASLEQSAIYDDAADRGEPYLAFGNDHITQLFAFFFVAHQVTEA